MAGWQSRSSFAASFASASASACACCHAERGNCSTPACCTEPSDDRVPVIPVAPRTASGYEAHVIVPTALAFFTLPRSPLHTLSIDTSSFLSLRAVPIFDRDCSYLI